MSRADGVGGPRVSVCVPAYEAERFLAATIESVLAQTFTDWEMIVLDNASEDRTGEIARSYGDPRIRVERNPTVLALPDNWSRVVGLARAPYIKVLCADDVIAPTCLAREVEVLDRRPQVVVVSSRRDFITAAGETVVHRRGLDDLLGFHPSAEVIGRVIRSGINPIGWPSSVLFRRADFEAVGGFDGRWLHAIDLNLWLRLLARGGFYGIGESLASFRISKGSITASTSDTGAQHRAMLRTFVAESSWEVPRGHLVRTGLRTRVEEIRLRLLFAAANSRWPRLRRLPSLVLDRRPGRQADPPPIDVEEALVGVGPASTRSVEDHSRAS